jgi:lipopolysaccharide transport system permease protein
MGVLVATLGVVYGALLGRELSEYLPMVAIGVVVWALFSAIVSDGSSAYIQNANYIRQVRTPRFIYILQIVWKSLVIFAHNSIIILLVILFSGIENISLAFLSIPGLLLLILNATWMAAFTGLMSARFRDFPQIVQALLQVAFYVTPILFDAKMLGKYDWIVRYNPLAYLVNIVREPLMGIYPSAVSWIVPLVMATVGWTIVFYLTGKYHKRIPYWV